jgi:hypothetical protein
MRQSAELRPIFVHCPLFGGQEIPPGEDGRFSIPLLKLRQYS